MIAERRCFKIIRAILFDFDGVLTVDKTGSESIINFISTKCGLSLKAVESNYYKYNEALLSDKISHLDMWESFCNDAGFKLDYNILLDAFKNTLLESDMINFVKKLKQKYLIGMITDNKADRIDLILEYNDLGQYFDAVSISSRVHSGKTERYIFEDALIKLNVSPEECMFIDNTEENLVVPANMGMQTILFDNANSFFIEFTQKLSS